MWGLNYVTAVLEGNCEVHIEHTNDKSNNSTRTTPTVLLE